VRTDAKTDLPPYLTRPSFFPRVGQIVAEWGTYTVDDAAKTYTGFDDDYF
jgi:hypothetical protein